MNARYLLVVGLLALSACDDSSSAQPDETAPPPTAAPTEPTSVPSTDPSDQSTTSTEAPSTEPVESTTSTPPESTIATTTEPDANAEGGYLPADLGTVVDSAPGVDSPGEVTELIDNVWFFVPSEPVENDPNVVPPLPEDQEILIAYAEAQAAYHEQASMNPIPAGGRGI